MPNKCMVSYPFISIYTPCFFTAVSSVLHIMLLWAVLMLLPSLAITLALFIVVHSSLSKASPPRLEGGSPPVPLNMMLCILLIPSGSVTPCKMPHSKHAHHTNISAWDGNLPVVQAIQHSIKLWLSAHLKSADSRPVKDFNH